MKDGSRSLAAKYISEALKGNIAAAKFVMSLFEKHVPMNLSLEELMEDKPVFAWTPEDEGSISKLKLLEGITVNWKPKDKD